MIHKITPNNYIGTSICWYNYSLITKSIIVQVILKCYAKKIVLHSVLQEQILAHFLLQSVISSHHLHLSAYTALFHFAVKKWQLES